MSISILELLQTQMLEVQPLLTPAAIIFLKEKVLVRLADCLRLQKQKLDLKAIYSHRYYQVLEYLLKIKAAAATCSQQRQINQSQILAHT